MLGGRSARKLGKQGRRILEPMAATLGVDYDTSFFTPPGTHAEFAMGAVRCGCQLMQLFADTDNWQVDDFGQGISKQQARQAARYVQKTLDHREGRDAVSMMAQGYGRATAAFWREAADTDGDHERAGRLRVSARASDQLADRVASAWPVRGYDAVLERVAHAEAHRSFEADNPDALVNLHDYARRMRANADALAVIMCERFDDFESSILGPVYSYHTKHDLRVSAVWTSVGPFWGNLVSPAPLAHSDVPRS